MDETSYDHKSSPMANGNEKPFHHVLAFVILLTFMVSELTDFQV